MTNEVGTGIREICDLQLRNAPHEPERPLEPGDIIVAKSTGSTLSKLIARFDGWWTHSAISLGADRVAHAHAGGMSIVSLAQFKATYEHGLAVARPKLDAASRSQAAQWAASIAKGHDPHSGTAIDTIYDEGDLGVAFSLLWRAARQPGIEELREIVESDLESADEPDERPVLSATCSGFVYRCYSEGSTAPLEIDPAPGVRIDNGHLVVPTRDALLDELRGTATEESPGLDKATLERWQTTLGIAVGGIAAAVAGSIAKQPVPLAQGVTPMDLWMSPTVGTDSADRWFIRGIDLARDATAKCNDAN